MTIRPAPVQEWIDFDREKKKSGITESWRQWLSDLVTEVNNKTAQITEGTEGNIVIINNYGGTEDSGVGLDKFRSQTYSTSEYLSSLDLGKIIKFNNGSGSMICYLPSLDETNIDSWVTIMRLGTGRLTIQAADIDTIEKSLPGGKIWCDEPGRVLANITLCLATVTKWAMLSGTGIWKVK